MNCVFFRIIIIISVLQVINPGGHITNVVEILNQRNIKKTEAREVIVRIIQKGDFSLNESVKELEMLKDKQIATFLEAVEFISGQKESAIGAEYLNFAKKYILSDNNSCKREASRIVGNMASTYPDQLDDAIAVLLVNTENEGTVVRWSSAYALSRIIVLKRYSESELVQQIRDICESETENGVRNQYVKALKKLG